MLKYVFWQLYGMKSPIKHKKLIHTYLHHPEKLDQRHAMVSTSALENYNPERNYSEQMQSMAFSTWNLETSPKGILEMHHDSEGIYAAHNCIVKRFLSQGYRKIKTEVILVPEGTETFHVCKKQAA